MSGLPVVNPADDLPEPIAIEVISDEALLAAWKVQFKGLWPAYNVEGLEFDYGVVNAEAMSILRTLDRARVNDAYRALRLPLAKKADLDGLAADRGLKRLVYGPATDTTDAVVEEDPELLLRSWLEMQRWARGSSNLGLAGVAWRLGLPDVTDVRVYDFPGQGRMRCILLPRLGLDVAGQAALLARVGQALNTRAVRPGSVIVDVVPAEVIVVDLAVTIGVLPGASKATAQAAADSAVRAYMASRRMIATRVATSRIEGKACQTNVVYAHQNLPADLVPTREQAYQLGSLVVTPEDARD